MARIFTLLLLSFVLCLTLGLPTEKRLSSTADVERIISPVSRQTRRDRVPLEDRILGLLPINGATLIESLRDTDLTPQITRLIERQRSTVAQINEIRAKLYGPDRVRGRERRQLILDEDVLFARGLLNGFLLERALIKRPGLRRATRQALKKQRRLGIELNNVRFGTFTV